MFFVLWKAAPAPLVPAGGKGLRGVEETEAALGLGGASLLIHCLQLSKVNRRNLLALVVLFMT